MSDNRGSGRKLKVTYTSDRAYTITAQNGLFIARYELLKTRATARLKSLYIGATSMRAAQSIAAEIHRLFNVRVEIRVAERCSTNYEVVVRSPKVAQMEAIERFMFTLISNVQTQAQIAPQVPQVAKVIPLYRPDLPRAVFAVGRDGRRLSI